MPQIRFSFIENLRKFYRKQKDHVNRLHRTNDSALAQNINCVTKQKPSYVEQTQPPNAHISIDVITEFLSTRRRPVRKLSPIYIYLETDTYVLYPIEETDDE